MEFSKQGFGTEEALKLSKVASEFQNIADTEIDAATAAKFINSQLKAFGNTEGFKNLTSDAEKAEKVIDSVNEVANNFGVGTNDLQMALTKTGAALKGYGNSYAETIGLITAGTEMLPNQASKVARGWRTIGANVLKLAQSEETLSAANGKVNISLRDSNGNMKSTFAILKDLHEGVDGQSVAWKDLSQEEQSAISLMLAGKTQTEVFKSTMDNFSQAIKANETALNSQGSAARENAKYLDSIQGRVQAFRSAWEQLSYHLVDSSTVKAVIGFVTTLIKGLDEIVEVVDKLPKPLSTVIGLLTAFGVVAGGLKLLNIAEGFTAVGKAAKAMTGAVEGAGEAASAVSGAKGLGALKSVIGFLTNPLVLGGLAALGVAIAAIEWDKYLSFENSLERLTEYENKLKTVTDEIEALKEKRDSDQGLTNAEKTHLAVLEAEERSLERQIALEKERIQNAFKADVNTKQGKRYQEQTGPTQLLDYQNARKEELALDEKITKVAEKEAKARKKAQEYRDKGLLDNAAYQEKVADHYAKTLDTLYKKYDKLGVATAEAASELAQYWEEVSNNVDYDSLNQKDKEAFDAIHKAFIESQIDASNLKDSYEEVSGVLNSAMDSLGHENLNLFDNIDISSIQTVEDAINAIKEQIQSLGEDTEITFQVKGDDGELETVTKKVSELTDEDYEAIIHFNETGVEEVESGADEASKDRKAVVDVIQNGAGAVSSVVDEAAKNRQANINVTDNNTAGQTQGQIDAIEGHDVSIPVDQGGETASGIQSSINSVQGKDVHINIFKTIWESIKKKAKGKRKGEQGGMAWLGDEGSRSNPKPELVVSEDGAYLAGTQGWELHNLKSSDIVYTAAQTKKLLGGSQTFSGSGVELPRFKKGKKSKAQIREETQKNASEETKEQWEKEFDFALKKLKHQAEVGHWTDATYQKKYKQLYNQYYAKAKYDQLWDYEESAADYANKVQKGRNDLDIGLVKHGANVANVIKRINKRKALTADERRDYKAKAYEAAVDYNLKEYENGKNTRSKILDNIKKYYKTRGKYDETYYEMVEELREADKEKELKRLETLQEKEANKYNYLRKYAQRQKDYYDKQLSQQQEEAEQLDKLVELQDKLNNAKQTMVRVYREGEGFVYEQDVNAVREATKALEEYDREYNSELKKKSDEWQAVIDLFDELDSLSEMKEFELSLGINGITDLTGKDIGTDINEWAKIIRTILSKEKGYEDIIDILENAEGTDIEKLLGKTLSSGNKRISNSVLNQLFDKHSFANGSLNTPSGFSIVGENGPELRYLHNGSAIFPNSISQNLMEWGQYSPSQILNKKDKVAQNQIFNFDKIVLPNVRNADDFYKELQQLPNKAIQQSAFRA